MYIFISFIELCFLKKEKRKIKMRKNDTDNVLDG